MLDTNNPTIESALRSRRAAIKAPEIASVIDVGLSTVYRYARLGVLPRLPLPGVIRFDPAQVADALFGEREG